MDADVWKEASGRNDSGTELEDAKDVRSELPEETFA